eukprot:TRINITY_DN57400_c0_g1_i1.p1 TRINITY_DN57400_c0_g1~~TRINITY_DN57400_c0_g1_i1.p1  ORF type:complete len:451 (-),score=56.41 TRINITY_DN57400_c0_g1_i1:537-1889(-)
MVWNSDTLIVCSPREQLEALWSQIHETYEKSQAAGERECAKLEDRQRDNLPNQPFCCDFLASRCSFGDRCRFSHMGIVTREEIGQRGCNQSFDCHFGHNVRPDISSSPAFDINDSLQDHDFTAKLNHQGPNYSIDDPLWLEASAALQTLENVCVQKFEPLDDESQLVTWILCTSPALLLLSLQGLDGDRAREEQRESSKQKLSVVLQSQRQLFRRRWPRKVNFARHEAARACAQLPRELPASGASETSWHSLVSCLARCSETVETFWRVCDGERVAGVPSEDEDGSSRNFLRYHGMARCSEIRKFLKLVREALDAVTVLVGSAAAATTQEAGVPTVGTLLDAVADWLTAEGFGEYRAQFLSEGIDARALRLLTEDHLLSLGVVRLGDRLNLIQAISARPPPILAEAEGIVAQQLAARSLRPKCFFDLVQHAARMHDGAVLVRHWVPGGVG